MSVRSFLARLRGQERRSAGAIDAPPPHAGDGVLPLILRSEAIADSNPVEAIRLIREAPPELVQDTRVQARLALHLQHAGRSVEALVAFRRAYEAGVRDVSFLLEFGNTLSKAGLAAEAREISAPLAAQHPESFLVQFTTALHARASGHWNEAILRMRRACALAPENLDAAAILSKLLTAGGDPLAGLALADALHRRAPDDLSSLDALAYANNVLGRPGAALAALDRLVEVAERTSQTVFGHVQNSRAAELAELGRHVEGAQTLMDQLRRRPDGETCQRLAYALISLGWFTPGWRLYGARWFSDGLYAKRPNPRVSRWSGDLLPEASVVVVHEQGIGDLIMFSRFVRRLRERCASTTLVVPPEYESLARTFTTVDHVVASGQMTAAREAGVSMVMLGDLVDTLGLDVEDVSIDAPYIHVPKARQEAWLARIPDSKRRKVGLVWAGSPDHVQDAERSIPLGTLRPLIEGASVDFYSFQKGPQEEVLAKSRWAGLVVDLAPDLRDFVDTLAALQRMDLLVSVDTSVAHAAGALCVPVWMLVALPSDYRWLLDGDASPWYPTMRIYRQTQHREWGPVVDAVAADLKKSIGVLDKSFRDASAPRDLVAPRRPALALGGLPHVVETRYGVLMVPDDESDESLSLEAYGEFLHPFSALAARLAQPGHTIAHIGAGVGELTLALSRRVGPGGLVFAIARDDKLVPFLRENVAVQRARNVSIWTDHARADTPGAELDRLGLESVDGIVADRGDNLAAVLAGATGVLWARRPWVLLALHSFEQSRGPVEVLASHGYRCWFGDVPLYSEANYRSRPKDRFGGRAWTMVLGLAEEHPISDQVNDLKPYPHGAARESADK